MLISVHCAFSQRDTTPCPWDIHQSPFNSLPWDEALLPTKDIRGIYRCRFKANSSPCSFSEAREGFPHFYPLKKEARGQRGSGVKLSSHALSVLRRCREREATCSSRESQHCWLMSRHDSEHKLQKCSQELLMILNLSYTLLSLTGRAIESLNPNGVCEKGFLL